MQNYIPYKLIKEYNTNCLPHQILDWMQNSILTFNFAYTYLITSSSKLLMLFFSPFFFNYRRMKNLHIIIESECSTKSLGLCHAANRRNASNLATISKFFSMILFQITFPNLQEDGTKVFFSNLWQNTGFYTFIAQLFWVLSCQIHALLSPLCEIVKTRGLAATLTEVSYRFINYVTRKLCKKSTNRIIIIKGVEITTEMK